MQDYDVTIVTLDNGKDYYVLKDITANNKRYCYFSNIENVPALELIFAIWIAKMNLSKP